MFGGLSLGDSYGYFTESVTKQQGASVGVALLEALAWRFIYFGESYIDPRHFQAGRIRGPGRG